MNFQELSKEELINNYILLQREFAELTANIEDLQIQADIRERYIKTELYEQDRMKLNILDRINDYSLDLAYLDYNDLFHHIVQKMNMIFGIKASWITTFDKKTSDLVVRYSSLSDEENASLMKVFGNRVIGFRTKVNQEQYDKILNEQFTLLFSLKELTFGAIPYLVSKTIERMLGIGWFVGLALMHKGELIGTMILVGDKNQLPPPKREIIAFAGITANALQRKKAEESLLAYSNRWNTIFNNINDGILLLNEKGDILQANLTAQIFLRKSERELKSVKFWACFQENSDPIAENNFVTFLEAKFRKSYIANYSDKWFQITLDPIFDANSEIESVISIISDITLSKKNELKLIQSEARYKTFINSTSDLEFLKDEEYRYIITNQANIKFLGRTENEIIGKTDAELMPPENAEACLKSDKQALISGCLITSEEEINGKIYEVRKFPVQLQNSKTGVGAIIRDITEQKTAEERIFALNNSLELKVKERTSELQDALVQIKESNYELQVLNNQVIEDSRRISILNNELLVSQSELKTALAAKDKFFSIIAHDLRGPFLGFLNLTELMARNADKISQEEMIKMSDVIFEAAESLFSLLDSLLQWARTQTGNIQFNPVEANAFGIVNSNFEALKQVAAEKSIRLINKIAPDYVLHCDTDMFNTIIRNLVSNAIKFTQEGGFAEVGILQNENDQREVLFYVSDNGVGISEQNLPKLFKVDGHLSTSGTKKEKGAGLGLLLCKEFVEYHKGKIWVESTVGKGSTFFFTINDFSKD